MAEIIIVIFMGMVFLMLRLGYRFVRSAACREFGPELFVANLYKRL